MKHSIRFEYLNPETQASITTKLVEEFDIDPAEASEWLDEFVAMLEYYDIPKINAYLDKLQAESDHNTPKETNVRTEILNCTPHAVNILISGNTEYDPRTHSYYLLPGENAKFRTIEPCGICPRCTTVETEVDTVDAIPTITVEYEDIDNLPPAKEGTYLIVSALVANAGRAQGRKDLLIPARLVRDEAGRIIGCLALAR